MKQIPTYIINLAHSTVRKQHMQNLLSAYPFLQFQFITAVNGKTLSKEERQKEFDDVLCLKHYGRNLNDGEVGCIMSHRKCYEALLATSASYALVLEDDIYAVRSLTELQLIDLKNILDTEMPVILLLSGDYWYYKKEKIVNVFDAVGGYAYFINRTAAKRILSIQKPYNVADDWGLYKSLGIKLKAIYPYLIDANVNMKTFGSDISQEKFGINRKKMSFVEIILSYKNAIAKRMLTKMGHFESKIRKTDYSA